MAKTLIIAATADAGLCCHQGENCVGSGAPAVPGFVHWGTKSLWWNYTWSDDISVMSGQVLLLMVD